MSQRHYFVINLPSCSDRRQRIVRRLHHHQISDHTTLVDAVSIKSPLLDWFEMGMRSKSKSSRPEHACFLSHLKALRAFVNNPNWEEAIILEDDAMLHNDFISRLDYILSERGDAPMIMLSYLAASWDGVTRKPSLSPPPFQDPLYLHTIQPKIFGAVGYWITRSYAETCLHRLDKPLRYLSEPFVTSELITRLSNGYFVSPPLVIEEAIYSTLRQGNDLNVHRTFFSNFNFDLYSNAEKRDVRLSWG